MKFIVIIGDGMADQPIPKLGGKTILEAAKKPNMDFLAKHGRMGLAQTVPDGYPPGSDVANMRTCQFSATILPNFTQAARLLKRSAWAWRCMETTWLFEPI